MKKVNGNSLRLVLSIDGKTYVYTKNITKRKIGGLNSRLREKGGMICGNGYVSYGEGYKNCFEFTNEEELMDRFCPCIEKELLLEFGIGL